MTSLMRKTTTSSISLTNALTICIVCLALIVTFSCGEIRSNEQVPVLEKAELTYEVEVPLKVKGEYSEDQISLPIGSALTAITAIVKDGADLDDKAVDRVLVKEITRDSTQVSSDAPGRNHTNVLLIPVMDGDGATKSVSHIDKLEVEFSVDEVWLTDNGYDPSEILVWEHDGRWSRVPTRMISNSDAQYHFVADVTDFGNIVISGTRAIDILDQEREANIVENKSGDEFSTLPRYLPGKGTIYREQNPSIDEIFDLKISKSSADMVGAGSRKINYDLVLIPKLNSEGELTLEIVSTVGLKQSDALQVCSRWLQVVEGDVINFDCSFISETDGNPIKISVLEYNLYWNGIKLQK